MKRFKAIVLAALIFAAPVFAGPSPARADGSFGLESLGGAWFQGQKPAVVAWPGRLDVFMVGNNGQLYHYWQGGGEPFQLESLGGAFIDFSVAAVSWERYRLDVFVIGVDHQLYHYWQAPGMWYFEHESLGGYWPFGDIEAVSWGPNRIDVFLLGNNNYLYHYWYPGGSGFGLEALIGSAYFYDLAAVAWPGRLDVFVLRPSGEIWHLWQNNGQPFYYESLATINSTQRRLAVASGEPGRLDVFTASYAGPEYGSTSTYVNHYWQLPGTGHWNRETVNSMAGGYAGPLSAVSWGTPRLDVFTRRGYTSDFSLHHYWRDTGASFGAESLGGSWSASPEAVSWGWPRLDVFIVGDNAQLYHYWQN